MNRYLAKIFILYSLLIFSCSEEEFVSEEEVYLGFSGPSINNQKELSRLNGVKIVKGDLIIESGEIETLYPLRNLEIIEGRLIVRHTKEIKNFNELSQLKELWSMHIENNEGLEVINFESLETDIDDIIIRDNSELKSVSGLDKISLKGLVEIKIWNNSSLESLEDTLDIPDSDVYFLEISENPSLKLVNWCHEIEFADDVYIEGNESLKNLDFLQNIKGASSLKISDNKSILNISLPSLAPGFSFIITDNPEILSVDVNMDGEVFENNKWPNSGSQHSNTHIKISNCPKIKTVKGFNGIKSAQLVEFTSNQNLLSIEGFNSLNNTEITIVDNPSLQRVEGFDSLKYYSICVNENPNLSTLVLHKSAEKIRSSFLHIVDNFNLTRVSLIGLDSLRSLKVNKNASMLNLDFISSLKYAKSVEIQKNKNLVDFCGLSDELIESIELENVKISNNSFNPTLNMLQSNSCSSQ